MILNNPCLDEAIVGTTKQGQIVYTYDQMVDAYAEQLLMDWDMNKEMDKVAKENKELLSKLNKKEKNKKITEIYNEKFLNFFTENYSNAMNFLDAYTIFPLIEAGGGNEVYFDKFDLEEDDFLNHGYNYLDEDKMNRDSDENIKIIKPLVIYGI